MKIAMMGSGAAGKRVRVISPGGGAEKVWLVDPNKAHTG